MSTNEQVGGRPSIRRFSIWLVAWLGIILIALLLVVWIGSPAPKLILPDSIAVSEYGKLTVQFSRPVTVEQIQANATIEPAVPGQWTVVQNLATFISESHFDPGQSYTLRISSLPSGGFLQPRIPAGEWGFEIRQPRVLFIGQTSRNPELWSADLDGTGSQQITHTGGKVTGFGVSRDGEWIAYSVENAFAGQDLWVVGRTGLEARQLVDCGADECITPVWSPDGSHILFEHQSAEAAAGTARMRLWQAWPAEGTAETLFSDPGQAGTLPSFSPDGSRIAFYDPSAGGIRIVAPGSPTGQFFPTHVETAVDWSPDGQSLLLNDIDSTAFSSYVMIYLANLQTNEFNLLFSETYDRTEYGLPVWSPDGKSVTIASRPVSAQMGKQLSIFNLDGSLVASITNNALVNYAAYSWEPAGRALIFQGFQLGSSDSVPEIHIWWRESGETRVIASDASQPAWLP